MIPQIMGLIITDPELVVEGVSGLLEPANEVEAIEQKLQLVDMIEKDPLAATVTFTDLMLEKMEKKQLENLTVN